MASVSVSGSDDGSSPAQRRSTTTSRRKKSASQIVRLEELYSENKYPSEEVRAKLSEELGLSEKQMQIWFTHRRHKDRKDGVADAKLTFYAMRHKGGEAHLDFMEELSGGKQRMGGNLLGKDDTSPDRKHLPVGLLNGGDAGYNGQHGTGRGTDSESENSGPGQAEDLHNPSGLKMSLKRTSTAPRKGGPQKKLMTMPPRSKVESSRDIEVAAISAVETQLGEAIRTDGPHLGLVFDAIPPGAWARLVNMGAAPLPIPAPISLPVKGKVPLAIQGRLPAVMQGRVGRMQSVGTY